MVVRRPLVRVGGQIQQLPDGDYIVGTKLYRKKSVHITSGTFTLPSTAMPEVEILAVGGGSSAGPTTLADTGNGSDTTVSDSTSAVLLTAEGATAQGPGRGGGVGASNHGNTATTSPGTPAQPGNEGWAWGGATAFWRTGGSGRAGNPVTGIAPATAGTGDGGGGNGNGGASGYGGNGGGVVREVLTLVPGETYTHVIGAGGVSSIVTPLGSGASGRVEYIYWDTVP